MLINVVTHCCMFTIWQEIFMAIMKFEYCVSCVEQPQLIHGRVLSRCRWSPAASGPAGPTTVPQVVRPDYVKLLQLVRPAAGGPPNEISEG